MPESAPIEHTVYPVMIEESEEVEATETVAFPPDSSNKAMAEPMTTAASITLSCNPVEYGTPVTTTKTVPVVAVIAVFEPAFPVVTGKTRESTTTTYGMGWLAPDPDKDDNDQTIEGIDVDNDCVRDDIENYIYRKYSGPGNIAKRKYLFEYAKWRYGCHKSTY